MKNQKGFAPIIGLIVVVIVLGASLYVYKNQQNQDINKETTTTPQDINKETTTTRLEGVFSYLNGNFTFLVFVNDNQDTHVIRLTFSNQSEVIKKLDIDISKLPADEWCSISAESVATIDVTGYDTERAEKDWKDEVTLKTVVVPATFSVVCTNKEDTTTRLEGVFSYNRGGLNFLVFVNDNQGTHAIYITFSNQDEAIKMFDIDISKLDISKLPADLPTVEWCSIMGESVATIDVTGYDTERAEKDWKDEVTLKTVVVPAVSSVFCATP